MSRILIEIHEGQIVRNLLENNFLHYLTQAGHEVLLISAGASVPRFVAAYQLPHVELRDLNLISYKLTRQENYELSLGKTLSKRGQHALRRRLWKATTQRNQTPFVKAAHKLLEEWRPDVVVSTHLSQLYGRPLVIAAQQRGILTVGNVMSWDNPWKGLRFYPDVVCCWSENNKQELITLNSVAPEAIRVVGAPAFDPYLAPEANWTREQFAAQLGLDPTRPILLFATLGQFSQQIDETNPLEVLLEEIDAGHIPNRPQVILRMHPWSRDAYFRPFTQRPDVVVSQYVTYIPALGWCPTREEAILAGNLLRHADVVISPGSTMSIEPAIFDTPTVVPVFNEYMPKVFEKYFEDVWIKQHFNRLHKNDWVPIVRSRASMVEAINHALADKTWYAQGRAKIREEFLGVLDGQATRHFADVINQALKG